MSLTFNLTEFRVSHHVIRVPLMDSITASG